MPDMKKQYYKCGCCDKDILGRRSLVGRGVCPDCFGMIKKWIVRSGSIFGKCKHCSISYNKIMVNRRDGLRYNDVCSYDCHVKHTKTIKYVCASRRRARVRNAYHESVDRMDVFKRDKYRCQVCNDKVTESTGHIDHVMPISKGGSHTLCNLQLLCSTCNIKKADKMPIGQTLSIFTDVNRLYSMPIDDGVNRECKTCFKVKPVNKFRKRKVSDDDGRRMTCIDCQNEKRRMHRKQLATDDAWRQKERERQGIWRMNNIEHRRKYLKDRSISLKYMMPNGTTHAHGQLPLHIKDHTG